ncbi:MAG: protein-disulfide reductase DsbD domain-containing protein [Chitinophagaceae bacterium]
MKKMVLLALTSLLFIKAGAQSPALIKKDLKVLYVGGSGNWEREAFKTDVEVQQDIQNRKASFVAMLNRFFTSVTAIDAKEYSQKMSESYDVTVMDGTPHAVTPARNILDKSGRIEKRLPAGYFSEDFDLPVLFIGEIGERLGRSVGLKADWYCLCLDANAHSFRKEHPIFNGPFKVKMTVKEQPTPEAAFHYEYFSDKPYPKSLGMWQVQTKGYKTDKYFRVGMVARPWGFEDSPDAEYISSGVCLKTLDAVALGRHGNFFHWGFAASPEYMTEEASTVMANAVIYISKFKGKGIIARKYNEKRGTREYLKEKKYYATKAAYDSHVSMNEEFSKSSMKIKQEAEAKQKKGEELTPTEKRMLSFRPFVKPTFADYLKQRNGDLFEKFGDDAAAYIKYYDDNKDYFYANDGLYDVEVDEDVKSLKIPYYDKRLLDKCINMLENGVDTAKANRILSRYTLADFRAPAAWRAWYEKYKSRMFFTETGGYVFMINTYDKTVEGNSYTKRSIAESSTDQVKVGTTDDDNPVSIGVGMVRNGENEKEVVVKVKIHPGYHIYSFVSEEDPYIETSLSIVVPETYYISGELEKPGFRPYTENGTTIYEGEITFKQKVSGKGSGEVVCKIAYQCCDSKICFPPTEKEFRISL